MVCYVDLIRKSIKLDNTFSSYSKNSGDVFWDTVYINLPTVVARQQYITHRDAFLNQLITHYLYVYD